MYVLGIDTTQACCSAAVFCSQQNRTMGAASELMQRGHAEALPQIIDKALSRSLLTLHDIDRFAVTSGPGTFTGVRIGLSAARGFALALDKPLAGITSLEAIARNHTDFDKATILAAFDARRHEVYVQVFSNGKPKSPPQLCDVDDIEQLGLAENTQIVGTASQLLAEKYPQLIIADVSQLPDAEIIARTGAICQPQQHLQPVYLRRADARAQSPLITIQPNQVHIASATPAHAQVLSALHEQGFSQPWSGQVMADSLNVPGTACQIAFGDKQHQRPLGFIMYRDAADEREILTLCVANDARRRKVAATLLTNMLAQSRETSLQKIFLEVNEENQPAINLYNKHDFSSCGKRPGYYRGPNGEKCDGVIMVHRL